MQSRLRRFAIETGASLYIVLTVLFPIFQTTSVIAFPDTIVKVEPQSSSLAAGEQFAVNITVAEVQDLWALEITVRWNATILSVVKIDVRLGEPEGALNHPVLVPQNSTGMGEYSLAATSMNPASSFNGSGIIVTLTFEGKKSGDSGIDLEAKLYDYPQPVAEEIVHTTSDGLAHVDVSTIPPLITILLVTLASAAAIIAASVILLRKRSPKTFERKPS